MGGGGRQSTHTAESSQRTEPVDDALGSAHLAANVSSRAHDDIPTDETPPPDTEADKSLFRAVESFFQVVADVGTVETAESASRLFEAFKLVNQCFTSIAEPSSRVCKSFARASKGYFRTTPSFPRAAGATETPADAAETTPVAHANGRVTLFRFILDLLDVEHPQPPTPGETVTDWGRLRSAMPGLAIQLSVHSVARFCFYAMFLGFHVHFTEKATPDFNRASIVSVGCALGTGFSSQIAATACLMLGIKKKNRREEHWAMEEARNIFFWFLETILDVGIVALATMMVHTLIPARHSDQQADFEMGKYFTLPKDKLADCWPLLLLTFACSIIVQCVNLRRRYGGDAEPPSDYQQVALEALSALAPSPAVEVGTRLGLGALHPKERETIWKDAGHIWVMVLGPVAVRFVVAGLARAIIGLKDKANTTASPGGTVRPRVSSAEHIRR